MDRQLWHDSMWMVCWVWVLIKGLVQVFLIWGSMRNLPSSLRPWRIFHKCFYSVLFSGFRKICRILVYFYFYKLHPPLPPSEPEEAPTGVHTTVMNSTIRVKWNEAQNVRGQLLGYKVPFPPDSGAQRSSLVCYLVEYVEESAASPCGRSQDLIYNSWTERPRRISAGHSSVQNKKHLTQNTLQIHSGSRRFSFYICSFRNQKSCKIWHSNFFKNLSVIMSVWLCHWAL